MASKKPWLLGCRWCGEVAERLIAPGDSTRWASSFWGEPRRFESFPLRLFTIGLAPVRFFSGAALPLYVRTYSNICTYEAVCNGWEPSNFRNYYG